MDVTVIISAVGTVLTVTLSLVAFIVTQARSQRDLIEKGDFAVREAERQARHQLANGLQRVADDLRRDVEALKKEAYRRDEAKDMESRLAGAVSKVETKIEGMSDRLNKLPAIEASIASLGNQVDKVLHRLESRSVHAE